MSLGFRTYKPLSVLVATMMSLYFVTQFSIQNYIIESNIEIVSLEKDSTEDSENKNTIEELTEMYKKFHVLSEYYMLLKNIDKNFIYYTEIKTITVNFDVQIPPPEHM